MLLRLALRLCLRRGGLLSLSGVARLSCLCALLGPAFGRVLCDLCARGALCDLSFAGVRRDLWRFPPAHYRRVVTPVPEPASGCLSVKGIFNQFLDLFRKLLHHSGDGANGSHETCQRSVWGLGDAPAEPADPRKHRGQPDGGAESSHEKLNFCVRALGSLAFCGGSGLAPVVGGLDPRARKSP